MNRRATAFNLTWGAAALALWLIVLFGAPETWGAEATPPPGVTVTIGGTEDLEWQAPTQNVDGTALTDLAAYRIYYGRASRNYIGQLDVVDGAALTWSFSIPIDDELDVSWYFAVTAIDGDGHESAYSNEVLKTLTVTFVNSTPPEAPVLIRVDMNLTCTTDSQFWTCTVTVQ